MIPAVSALPLTVDWTTRDEHPIAHRSSPVSFVDGGKGLGERGELLIARGKHRFHQRKFQDGATCQPGAINVFRDVLRRLYFQTGTPHPIGIISKGTKRRA